MGSSSLQLRVDRAAWQGQSWGPRQAGCGACAGAWSISGLVQCEEPERPARLPGLGSPRPPLPAALAGPCAALSASPGAPADHPSSLLAALVRSLAVPAWCSAPGTRDLGAAGPRCPSHVPSPPCSCPISRLAVTGSDHHENAVPIQEAAAGVSSAGPSPGHGAEGNWLPVTHSTGRLRNTGPSPPGFSGEAKRFVKPSAGICPPAAASPLP